MIPTGGAAADQPHTSVRAQYLSFAQQKPLHTVLYRLLNEQNQERLDTLATVWFYFLSLRSTHTRLLWIILLRKVML